jgi:DNA repair photolyase
MNDPRTDGPVRVHFRKGRGVGSNAASRFDALTREPDREYCEHVALEGDDEDVHPRTQITVQVARSIISRNESPDIPFDQSINPYLGCEHGCAYCYARPTHAYLGLSPGLDFETKIFAKVNAADLLRRELSRSSYVPAHIALGANTDPYQPIERKLGITREILKVLADFQAPVGITTKSALVTRDIDILGDMASKGLARVYLSIGTLDAELARTMEPRANSPARRLEAIRRLTDAGVPVGVFTSPLIPGLNDKDMEQVLDAAAQCGAVHASYVMLRLPLEVRDIFVEWISEKFPLRAKHVLSLVNQMHEGRDYDPRFGSRMTGTGQYADMMAQRFKIATLRLGLKTDRTPMDASQFRVPVVVDGQLPLF